MLVVEIAGEVIAAEDGAIPKIGFFSVALLVLKAVLKEFEPKIEEESDFDAFEPLKMLPVGVAGNVCGFDETVAGEQILRPDNSESVVVEEDETVDVIDVVTFVVLIAVLVANSEGAVMVTADEMVGVDGTNDEAALAKENVVEAFASFNVVWAFIPAKENEDAVEVEVGIKLAAADVVFVSSVVLTAERGPKLEIEVIDLLESPRFSENPLNGALAVPPKIDPPAALVDVLVSVGFPTLAKLNEF